MRDWYRTPDWDDAARVDFEQRLGRARSSRPQYLKIKALALWKAGLVGEAVQLFERMLTEHPGDHSEVTVLEYLADIARQQGRLDEAEQGYRDVLSRPYQGRGTTGMAEVSLAEVLLDLARPHDASAVLERVRGDDQVMDVVTAFHANLFRFEVACSRAAAMSGDDEAAATAATNALGLIDLPDQYSRHPGVGAVHADEPTRASLEAMVSAGLDARMIRLLDGGDVQELNDLGCDLDDVGRAEDARRCYEAAMAGGSQLAPYNLGRALQGENRFLDAVELFRLARARGYAPATFELGLTLLDLGHYADALPHLQEALADGEQGAHTPIGLALHGLGDLAAARRSLRAASATGDTWGTVELALLLDDLGEHQEARALVARGAATGHAMARAVDASWRWQSTRDPSLETDLRQAADDWSWARFDLADLLCATGRVSEAIELLQAGAARGVASCWLQLAVLYADLDEPDAAESALLSGIAAGDDGCHSVLAGVLEHRGDLDGAVFHYRLAAANGDAEAAEALRRLSATE